MKRFVPNYTCKKVEETSITCLKVLSDYINNVKIYEKQPKDYSLTAVSAVKKIKERTGLSFVTINDVAELAGKNFKTLIVKEAGNDSNVLKENLFEKITDNAEQELLHVLKDGPVMLLVNLNELYNQRNAGIGWVVVTEYNLNNDEFIIYDPLYYTRIPKSKNWERLPNTPRQRFIVFRRAYFFSVWHKTQKTVVFLKNKSRGKGLTPFFKEFLVVTKKDI